LLVIFLIRIGICSSNEGNEIFHKPFLQFFLSHCACKSDNLHELPTDARIYCSSELVQYESQRKISIIQVLNMIRIPVGLDSAVGTTTVYELGDPGIEFRWRQDFLHRSSPALGPTQPPKQWVPDIFLRQNGRGVALTTHPF
jgi:hypothetical protein